MRGLLLSVLLLLTLATQAQHKETYSFDFKNMPLTRVLDQVSEKTGYTIYYAPEWIDTVMITALQMKGTVDEVVISLIEGSKLTFVIVDHKIILTYNNPIISELPKRSEDAPAKEYLFAREYGDDIAESNAEDMLHVIGNKSKMKVGGSSLLVGHIRAEDTGEALIGASIETSEKSTTTDGAGFYSLRLRNGKNKLTIRYAGMKQTFRNLVLFSDGKLDISMEPEVLVLDELVFKANADENINQVQMGINKIELEEIKNIPKVLGENDLVKAVLTLPGVQSVGEGASGFNVRGGKTDQNLLLLNNSTIYNPFHFFGFFSSFNADILQSTELYKSSIPVNFGGRLASVLDVEMRAGNKEKISGQGGISPVTSQLSLELPLIKGSTSLIVGGRTTYSDWILNTISDETISNSDPFFFDLAGGIDHTYGNGNNINTNAYYSYDQFRLSTDSLYSYSNFGASFGWEHHFNDKWSIRLNSALSKYEYRIAYEEIVASSFEYGFDVNDVFGQASITYTPTESHSILFGFDMKSYEVSPGYKKPLSDSSLVVAQNLQDEQGLEGAVFISDNFRITDKLSLQYGVRYSGFAALGPGVVHTYDESLPRSPTSVQDDSISYSDNEVMKFYAGPEWRISGRYVLNKQTSVKVSYNRTRQYIHMLSNNVSISPVDVWKISDQHIRPQWSDQYAVGLFKNFLNNSIEASVELYYKNMGNLLDYKTGATLVLNDHIETDVIQGKGRAYGGELLIKKNTGRLNGWVAYTYSRSLQQFVSEHKEETINNGSFFPSNFDKPHNLNLITNYKFTRRYSLSFNLVYASGRPVTYPTAYYEIGGVEVVHYAERNRFRIPDYFRVDIGINIEGNHKLKKLAHSFWSFSVYNVLGRNNPYSVYFENNGGQIQGYQLSVLARPIPSVSYKFKF